MIEVKNLVKKYGNHLAVDHLDFQIKPGMVYGFLGPNGAGKSTRSTNSQEILFSLFLPFFPFEQTNKS